MVDVHDHLKKWGARSNTSPQKGEFQNRGAEKKSIFFLVNKLFKFLFWTCKLTSTDQASTLKPMKPTQSHTNHAVPQIATKGDLAPNVV